MLNWQARLHITVAVILYNNLTCFTTRPASYGRMICYQSNEMMTNFLGRTIALLHWFLEIYKKRYLFRILASFLHSRSHILATLSIGSHFLCEQFFQPIKIFSSVTKLHRCHREDLEAYNNFFIYCQTTQAFVPWQLSLVG